ncbi:HAMP domain-containing sensor histidine kinase [Paenibacillus peoriae]|uniref:sensor histidine kinase n=1 Tax=Paenibacillus peoriae TaxID=59893 RepID=UPI00026C67EA|nr:HAMP domain-containing sensor histidine kinase [Paenibacillus peoriae]MEC0180601.1 HAMP domain-containing sensor histidine kinase [Paenibacillus peoriae]
MSIRWRLTAWYSSILAIVLVIFGLAIYGLVYYYTYNEVKSQLMTQAPRINKQLLLTIKGGLFEVPNLDLGLVQGRGIDDSQLYVQIYNYTSGVTKTTQNMKDLNITFPVPSTSVGAVQNEGIRRVSVEGDSFMIYQQPIKSDELGLVVGFLQIGQFTGSQDRLMNRLQSVLVYGSLFALLAAATSGLFLARKSMKPLVKVIEGANQIQSSNDLSVRIEYDGPADEIGQLIGTVNNMLERTEAFYKELEDAYGAQRRFVADASHELRTPLTTIRGNVDFLVKMWTTEPGERPNMDEAMIRELSMEALSDMADEGQRMSRLVGDMLSLARADTGKTFDKTPVALEPLVNEVARRAQFLERTAEWNVGDFSLLNGIYMEGSKDYLQQMLFIFIDNAFKYTPEGIVRFDAIVYQGQVGLRISDTGIGMDKSQVPFIFDRFYRADESRGVTEGIGLGLSIAKWIIDEHHGSVEVVTRQGEGTTFIIWLPVSFSAPLE